tara:strand:- start:267 stop:497 length:231 start_codon:yes stop_codon:yes gene_type:complete
MLGEIRSDLKWLVEERRSAARRVDDLEEKLAEHLAEHGKRLTKLEGFKIRIATFTAALGVLVPTAITVAAKKLGLL